MMLTKFLSSLILIVVAINSYSQRPVAYTSRWQTKPTFGFNIPITTLAENQITDYLLDFDDRTVYWQIISATHFFHKHWGIEFNFQASASKRTLQREDKFIQALTAEYGNNFFIFPSTGSSYDKFNVIGGDIERGYLGVIYRIESNRFFIYPKVAVGVTSFFSDYGSAFLKEKNSNKVVKLMYSFDKRPNDHLSVAASASFGYKFTRRIFLNVDAATSYYKTNVTFLKSITDQTSGQEILEDIRYKKDIFTLSLGAGLIIVIF
jgi:hypothetical protein